MNNKHKDRYEEIDKNDFLGTLNLTDERIEQIKNQIFFDIRNGKITIGAANDEYVVGKYAGLTQEEVSAQKAKIYVDEVWNREGRNDSQNQKNIETVIEENVGENIEAVETTNARNTDKKFNIKKIGVALATLAITGTILLGGIKFIDSALDTKKNFQIAENYIEYVLESSNNHISDYNNLPETLQILIEEKVYTDAQERKENPQEALRSFLEENNVSETQIPEKVSAKINHFEAPPYYEENINEMVQTGTIYEILKPQSKGVSK